MLKMIMLTIYLLVGAAADIRRRSVPLIWLIFGGVMTLLLLISSFIAGPDITQTARNSASGAGVALPFLAISLVRPRHLGRADGAAILMIGLLTGPFCTACAVMIALLLAAIGGITQTIARRGDTAASRALAFLPCLTAGLIGAQFL